MKKILCIDSNHDVLHETLIDAGFHCDLFWNKSKEELKLSSILKQQPKAAFQLNSQ